MRLIDADALLDYLLMMPIDLGYREVEEIEKYVKEMPTIEPERKKGKWIFKRRWHEADECSCSLCGQLMTTFMGERKKYCPDCGAKMEVTE